MGSRYRPFWAWVEKTETCWLWKGRLNNKGYGQASLKGRMRLAHRLAWELLRGPIPEGAVLDHLCRVRRCVNPDHLEPVTTRENLLRGEGLAAIHARQEKCAHGHAFTPANTYQRPEGRYCRACRAATMRAQRRRTAAAKETLESEVANA